MRIDQDEQSVLNERMIWAVQRNQVEVLKLLLEFGADVHAQNDAALRLATMNGHTECVKLLKQYMNK